MVRKWLAVRTFVSHPKQILDKTQTEFVLEFKAKYREIKIGKGVLRGANCSMLSLQGVKIKLHAAVDCMLKRECCFSRVWIFEEAL